ncbi:alanine dehydrogenase [Nesterenkonia sp. MY13]|uniref:Alanine dehydrogenase n=1 Tax=Nesterenkonia sedimenti TaxID=1463632 RepID=A0A7X8TJK5_9MICC|nr:alanine dehydrogenase [Nesterenkonia sedimenti]NLS09995.1 alanine dehydrogenase [Nesterenkonia sedimenti]
MHIGVPTEVKNHEYRVALTPAGVDTLVKAGHSVDIQAGAGSRAGYTDEEYAAAGAGILAEAAEAWAAEMVLKVKEPIAQEYGFLRKDLILFTYLHLAANRELTEALLAAGTVAFAYEGVEEADGSLPLLTPMSEVAGRLAPLEGANHLRSPAGGRGVLLPGVPGTPAGKVTIIGGGIAGTNAARVALGLGAEVTVLDVSLRRLRELDTQFQGRLRTRASTPYDIAAHVAESDLIIGAVLIPGARAPKLVTEDMVRNAKPGAVFVDIAVDQGGCFENSRPTTHDEPVFEVHGTQFYCVANMPGAVPATSTPALTNATLPFAERLATLGWEQAMRSDQRLAHGLSTAHGSLHSQAVAEALDLMA